MLHPATKPERCFMQIAAGEQELEPEQEKLKEKERARRASSRPVGVSKIDLCNVWGNAATPAGLPVDGPPAAGIISYCYRHVIVHQTIK